MIIALGSVTYAMKGKQALEAGGTPCEIVRLEAGATRRGCAYGLSVPSSVITQSTRILRRASVPYSEIISAEDTPSNGRRKRR